MQTIYDLTTAVAVRIGTLGRGGILAFAQALALVFVALSVVVDGGNAAAQTTLEEDFEFLCYAAGGC